MHVFKAKKNQGQDSEDESECFTSPCFEIDRHAELKDIPTNGHEYLLKVMSERKNYRFVTICSKDTSKFDENRSCQYNEFPELEAAPDALKPTLQWQEIQANNFSIVRKTINKERLKYKTKRTARIQSIDFFSDPPKLSRVLALHQKQVNKGLILLLDILKEVPPGDSIEKDIGVWIYSLLACLDIPLLSDTISILRDLARQCAMIRSQISLEEESALELVAPLNLIICLVAKYYEQIDLADTGCPDK